MTRRRVWPANGRGRGHCHRPRWAPTTTKTRAQRRGPVLALPTSSWSFTQEKESKQRQPCCGPRALLSYFPYSMSVRAPLSHRGQQKAVGHRPPRGRLRCGVDARAVSAGRPPPHIGGALRRRNGRHTRAGTCSTRAIRLGQSAPLKKSDWPPSSMAPRMAQRAYTARVQKGVSTSPKSDAI